MKLTNEPVELDRILREVKMKFFSNDKMEFSIKDKGEFDLVTSADIEVEEYIIGQIKKLFPDDQIISEESRSLELLKERNWIIDPIDGTCNFANHIPLYGVQLTLMNNSEPVMSYIMLPKLNEIYYAEKNKGAYLNGKKISARTDVEVSKAIVSFGDFSKSNLNSRETQVNLMSKLNDKVLKFRMFGASCHDFCFLASGRTHAHVMFSKNLWDIMPGYLLAKEAGVSFYNIDGDNFDIAKGSLVGAVNDKIKDCIVHSAIHLKE